MRANFNAAVDASIVGPLEKELKRAVGMLERGTYMVAVIPPNAKIGYILSGLDLLSNEIRGLTATGYDIEELTANLRRTLMVTRSNTTT